MTRLARCLAPAFAVVLLLFAVGCNGDPPPNVQIEVGDRSDEIPDVQTEIVAPEDGDLLEEPDTSVVVSVENFEIGALTETMRAETIADSPDGQHTHVVINNEPYQANYENDEPFDVGVLEEGPNTIFVFASRSYHESVKGADAYDMVNVYVGEEEGDFMLEPDDEAAIYSRPTGTYSGADAERVMIDFYLHNVELSEDGHHVHYAVHDADAEGDEPLASVTMTEWTPAFVTGLEPGTYTVAMELRDEEGNVVPGEFNSTQEDVEITE